MREFDKKIKEIREDRKPSGWRNGALMGMREGRELTLKEVEDAIEIVERDNEEAKRLFDLD